MKAYYTDHFISQIVMKFFSSSLEIELNEINNFKDPNDIFCTYGILRGTEDILKKSSNFIYLDNGYLEGSARSFIKKKGTQIFNMTGHYRVVKNDLVFNNNSLNISSKRFKLLNLELKEPVRSGDNIILSEPSNFISKYFNLNNWIEKTIRYLREHTDRKIIVHNKFSKEPLQSLLKNAFAFVSFQSTAGFRSIIEGVPAYFTHPNLRDHGDIKNINDRVCNYNLLNMAANSQWKLKEFFSEDFRDYIKSLNS